MLNYVLLLLLLPRGKGKKKNRQ